MIESAPHRGGDAGWNLKALVGSGDRIGLFVAPFAVVGVILNVPRGELITTGPFAAVKHPIYTAAAMLVLPWVGLLLNTWVGVVVGLALYAGARRFAPAEERELAEAFGAVWSEYTRSVKLRWL